MLRASAVTTGVLLLGLAAGVGARAAAPPSKASPADQAASLLSADAQNQLVASYCSACHNDRAKAGGLSLQNFDAATIERDPVLAEKMIRKLRAGMMPPPTVTRRPEAAQALGFARTLETRIDAAAAARPNPGGRSFQRLNRAEYVQVIHDLLDVDFDANAFLPPDVVSSRGFDNMADEQSFSPTLMQGYLRAASSISRLAVGDNHATPSSTIYSVSDTVSQMRHVEGAPMGTRGGVSVVHVFPADGDYTFKLQFFGGPVGDLYGRATVGEQIEISIDGERVAILDINPRMHESGPGGLSLQTQPAHVAAGPRRLSAAFIQRADGPVNDVLAPIEFTLGDTNIGNDAGVTAPPHLKTLAVSGPFKVTGVSENASRRKIFTCHPTSAAAELPCATSIIKRLAADAYRGQATADDLADLMRFYRQGRGNGSFETGIRLALQGILANPRFLFRLESAPPGVKGAETYRIADLDLASRLSFFLWATGPDRELLDTAARGELRKPAVLDREIRRMIADRRSQALATRFAAQWLRLRDLESVRPDQLQFPQWDQTLVDASKRETELFFDSLIREDRTVLDLITADYTFVNERLAKHYGVPNIIGNEFRRVTLPDATRRGLLGQASILMATSVADRTSPVLRGKWIMNVLLGSPPPPPPPNVPTFDETNGIKNARVLSVRERMEAHRANPACTSCHRVIDPLGLALENFDAIGSWRIKDGDTPVDATGTMYDGSKLDGPASLREALLRHSDVVILSFIENLMTYALGRPVEYYDMPAIRSIVAEASASGNRMSAFVVGIVKSTPFQMAKAAEATTSEAAAAGASVAAKASRK